MRGGLGLYALISKHFDAVRSHVHAGKVHVESDDGRVTLMLTPTEARKLAADMVNSADEAEKQAAAAGATATA